MGRGDVLPLAAPVRAGAMPKLKTKSAVKKRFSFTGSGKLKRNHAGKRHFMRRRPKRFIRGTRRATTVDAADEKMVKRLLPHG